MELENGAGCPSSKEGGSFIVDFVLKEFLLCVLPITLSPPPTHFNLKTQKNLWFIYIFIVGIHHLCLALVLYIHCRYM